MAGAGISTASGIPDFRSPGTGLYYNTKKYNVANPTDVFDLKYFNRNPNPFLDIIRDFIRSDKQPNSIHKFCKTLESHGLLLRMYTQNIDGLEKKSGISPTKLVEAHGTLESASCCKCFAPHSPSWTEKMILAHRVPSCRRKSCSGYVKPDVVMFGEELPKKFYLYPKDFQKCDLLIIMGTSLNVEPFSELVDAVPRKCPRVLLNRDAVGPFTNSRRKNDIFIPGDITNSLKQVVKLVGWTINSPSDDSSSSGSNASESEENMWASSRKIREIAIEKNPKPHEPVCLPNSVIRKSSQHQLVNKMSLLTVESTKAAKSLSRRSVSAPIPKTEQMASDQTIPTEISENTSSNRSSAKTVSEKGINDRSISGNRSSEKSVSEEGICVTESENKDSANYSNENGVEKSVCLKKPEDYGKAENGVSSKAHVKKEWLETTEPVEKIKIFRGHESEVAIPDFIPVGPRARLKTEGHKLEMLNGSKLDKEQTHEFDETNTQPSSPKHTALEPTIPTLVKDPFLPSCNSNPSHIPTLQRESDKLRQPRPAARDRLLSPKKQGDGNNTLDCLKMKSDINKNNNDDTALKKVGELSNHNTLDDRKSAPPGPVPAQTSEPRYPFSSAVRRVNKKPAQAKPLYNVRKFAHIKESNNKISRTGKTSGIVRGKTSKNNIARKTPPEDGSRRCYTNLLTSDTSEIFKKEFNEFLTSAKAETIKSHCSKTKSSARLRRKSGRQEIVVSPFTSYKQSSRAVRSKLQVDAESDAYSPWKLSGHVGLQNGEQLKDLRTVRKADHGKTPKKQVVLHSKPFVRFRKTGRNSFQWREDR